MAKETGFSLSKIHSLTTGARKSDEETTRLVAEKLGYPGRRYEDFLDIGRRALGLPVAGKADETPPAPETAELLNQARRIIEAGGEKAETLKNLIKIMKE